MAWRGAHLLGGGGVGPGGSGGGRGAEGLRQLGEHLRGGKRITVSARRGRGVEQGRGPGGTRWREGTDASGSEPSPRDAQHLRRDPREGEGEEDAGGLGLVDGRI